MWLKVDHILTPLGQGLEVLETVPALPLHEPLLLGFEEVSFQGSSNLRKTTQGWGDRNYQLKAKSHRHLQEWPSTKHNLSL